MISKIRLARNTLGFAKYSWQPGLILVKLDDAIEYYNDQITGDFAHNFFKLFSYKHDLFRSIDMKQLRPFEMAGIIFSLIMILAFIASPLFARSHSYGVISGSLDGELKSKGSEYGQYDNWATKVLTGAPFEVVTVDMNGL